MQKLFKPFRLGLILAGLAVALSFYVSALYKMQIYDARPEEDDLFPRWTVDRRETLVAARGSIYDRNGVLLASGRPAYNITMTRDVLLRMGSEKYNGTVLELVYAAVDAGIQYSDTFPITQGPPFLYLTEMTSQQRSWLDAYLAFYNLNPDIPAADLINWMRRSNNYDINYTVGIMEARLILGVRYELEMRAILNNLAPYVFAHDVDADFASLVEERGLAGVNVESTSVREYHTTYAGHLLGYIGQISSDSEQEIERFRELGYPMDALVGKMGAELAFEELLHGVDGRRTITMTDTGAVYDVKTVEPEPGSHVYLSLDIGLQMAVEKALQSHIEATNLDRELNETEPITGGAVVVTDVRTGEVLASASNPTFDQLRSTQAQYRGIMNSDTVGRPMWNRAMQGRYSPGSTFKMVTAYAVLREGIVGRWTEINDVGRFTKYPAPQPACWIFNQYGVGHGPLNIVQAIEHSCNYFFCAAADRIGGHARDGEAALVSAATAFGFGLPTGIELPEITGIVATNDFTLQALGEVWNRGDTLLTAFGQGHNMFTPIQMANYAATIANGGKLNKLTILSKIRSADMTELLYTHTPTVMNEIAEKEYIEILQLGMRGAVSQSHGTANGIFGNYPVLVSAKTGTVQQDTSDVNNAVFVCYAPSDDPQIAISVVIEKGGSGREIMSVARDVFDYYFMTERTFGVVPYGNLIP